MKFTVLLSTICITFLLALCNYGGCQPNHAISHPCHALNAIVTLTYQDTHLSYAYEDLIGLESYQGNGGRLKVTGEVTGPLSYTGVRMSTIKNQFSSVPSSYGVVTVSSDGFVQYFSHEQAIGDVMVYDTDGEEIGVGGVAMMLAYKEEGISDFSGGPFRVAWVNQDDPITDAFLWSKYIEEIEFIDDSTGDTTAPSLSFEKPVNGLYLFNRRIMPFFIPFIVGDITVQVAATDASGLSQVIIMVDDELKVRMHDEPFEWTWDDSAFGKHVITLVTYDAAGNIAMQEQHVWMINP